MEWLTEIWVDLVVMSGTHIWVLLVGTIIILTVVADLLQRFFLKKAHIHLERKNKIWLDSFVDAARSPLSFFIWVNGTVLAVITVMNNFHVYLDLIPYIQAFKSTVLTLAVGWYVIRFVQRAEVHLKAHAKTDERLDEVTVEALSKIIKLIAFVLTTLFFLSAFGVSLTGLLAFGGMGGIAIGFAAKDLLGNVFGGLMLYMDKPFTVGDWIRSPDKEIEGTVEKIGWRMTVVRTFDKRPLYIPNGIFANISIENPSRMTNRRIKETIGIRYSDIKQMHNITEAVKVMLRAHPEIDTEQTMIVNFDTFAPSSLDFFIYTFTKTTQWVRFHEIKAEILLMVADIIEAHGADIAFPSRSLYIESNAAEFAPK